MERTTCIIGLKRKNEVLAALMCTTSTRVLNPQLQATMKLRTISPLVLVKQMRCQWGRRREWIVLRRSTLFVCLSGTTAQVWIMQWKTRLLRRNMKDRLRVNHLTVYYIKKFYIRFNFIRVSLIRTYLFFLVGWSVVNYHVINVKTDETCKFYFLLWRSIWRIFYIHMSMQYLIIIWLKQYLIFSALDQNSLQHYGLQQILSSGLEVLPPADKQSQSLPAPVHHSPVNPELGYNKVDVRAEGEFTAITSTLHTLLSMLDISYQTQWFIFYQMTFWAGMKLANCLVREDTAPSMKGNACRMALRSYICSVKCFVSLLVYIMSTV